MVRLRLNRRICQALDAGLSVTLPLAALQVIGLKNRLAASLYYLVASKRNDRRPVEVSADVLEQIIRPTDSWRRNFRVRTEAACRLIHKADPTWHLAVVDARSGRWKVVATRTQPDALRGEPALDIRPSSHKGSAFLPQTFGLSATGPSRKVAWRRAYRQRGDHRAPRDMRSPLTPTGGGGFPVVAPRPVGENGNEITVFPYFERWC